MNLIDTFQDLVAHVPELVRPLIIALAGAVPFVEGEGAVTIGILGGIHPVVAAISAIVGNFVCVALLVLLGSGARAAIVSRRRGRALVTADGAVVSDPSGSLRENAGAEKGTRKAARHEKFQRAFERYGVPGVSLLGPLLLPTMFTATALVAVGVGKGRVLVWQAVAIIGWTTLFALLVTGVLRFAA